MPHKIDVMQYCDTFTEDAKEIGSVNYLTTQSGILKGFNYDGIASLNVIEKRCKVKDKIVVVYGVGGAGRAAIYEAKKRGAKVLCVNRNNEKAAQVAKRFDVAFCKYIPQKFDVFINATPIGMNSSDKREI